MAGLPYDARISYHHETKAFSIDPFNEVGIPTEERDSLLIKDFLESFEGLSESISEKINRRYHRMGQDFG